MLFHPAVELLLAGLRLLRQSRRQLLALAGTSLGVLESLAEIADGFFEGFFFGQSDGLGSLERFHVVGDDFVFLGEFHDSGLVVGKTVVGALSLDLESRQLLGDLIVFFVRILGDHLGLLQLLFQLLDTLRVQSASALQHFASTIGILASLGSLGEFSWAKRILSSVVSRASSLAEHCLCKADTSNSASRTSFSYSASSLFAWSRFLVERSRSSVICSNLLFNFMISSSLASITSSKDLTLASKVSTLSFKFSFSCFMCIIFLLMLSMDLVALSR